jgi:hypothetical protein
MLDIEIGEEFRKPPSGWLLYQMGISSIGKNLLGRPGRDSEESNAFCNPDKVFYNVRQEFLFDMLQHVYAADEIGSLWFSVTWEDRIIREVVEPRDAMFFETRSEIAFSRAVIRYGMSADRLKNLCNNWCVGKRSHTVVRIRMEGGLKVEILVRYGLGHSLRLWREGGSKSSHRYYSSGIAVSLTVRFWKVDGCHLGHRQNEAMPGVEKTKILADLRDSFKVGDADPRQCGSGRKFAKCCGA